MSPITHFLAGWMVSNLDHLSKRDRLLVAVAGVIPDLDGAGIVAEILTRHSPRPLTWWSDYHHVLGHNLGFALVTMAVSFCLATRRWKTALLAGLSFHLHLLGDIVGACRPEGHQWPIPYLLPFSRQWQWMWPGQWALNAWPNFLITFVLLAVTFYLAWRRGFSPLEMFSQKTDKAFVAALRRRFPVRAES